MRFSSILMSIADCTNCSMHMRQTFLLIAQRSDLRKYRQPIATTQLCLWLLTTLTTSLLCAVQPLTSIHKWIRCFHTMVKFNLLTSSNQRKTCRLRCYKLKNMIVSLHMTQPITIIGNTTLTAIKFIHHHKHQFSLLFYQLWNLLLSSSRLPKKVLVKCTPLL